jgi:hypothetical protein
LIGLKDDYLSSDFITAFYSIEAVILSVFIIFYKILGLLTWLLVGPTSMLTQDGLGLMDMPWPPMRFTMTTT